ncbi:uracil-DNA glycosylase [bacterium]|nr:uracil-DNA glycosylase [bacterium]MDY3757624.1 uracil-DNA glycosylase [Bacilli bacterium]
MIGNDWDEKLSIVWNSPGFHKFWHIIEHEYQTKTIYPTQNNIFNALKLTPYSNTKVVIVGQDPYHGENQAHGLSFSVQKGVTLPPSLKNIYKEIYDDLGIEEPNCGDLTKWAKEGVLLLNSSLTVIKDMPNSHKDIGWSNLTDYIIKVLNQKEEPVVFILWGNFAKSKKQFITNKKHLILESTHPSPFSASSGFFGSHPFSKTNAFLDAHGLEPINWQL